MGYTTTKEILTKAHKELRRLYEIDKNPDLYDSVLRHAKEFDSLLHEVERVRHYAKHFMEEKLPRVQSEIDRALEG